MPNEVSFFLSQIFHLYPVFWYSSIVLLSAIAGSFITLLCYRLPIMLEWTEAQIPNPNKLNLFLPRSFCPKCNKTLRWWHNIPLLSYCLLRGKCRYCQHTIAASYFMIELSCVLISVLTATLVNHPIDSLWWCLFVWIAITMVILDSRYLLLPDSLNYSLLWSGLVFALIQGKTDMAIISAIIGYISFAVINIVYKWVRKRDGIGQGDFKLLAGIAVWVSWYELPQVVLVGSILGLCYALIIFVKEKSINLSLTLPFAPFLLIGTWLWVMYLHV